jgi:hypothetical protein
MFSATRMPGLIEHRVAEVPEYLLEIYELTDYRANRK